MASATPKEIPPPLLPVLAFLSDIFETLRDLFHRIPGSPILLRYIKSSYQNDPYRSLLELFLVAFALRTVLKGRTRGEGSGKNWVKFTEKEVDELVDEWTPQPLVDAPSAVDEDLLESIPVIHGANGSHVKLAPGGKTVLNMALPNWAGMVESDKMKQVAIDTLREYGVGTCGPSGFYGTIDVHMKLEEELAAFIGTEAAILYAQAFAAVSSVIPAFAKRGDIIVADRGVNFAIHKGLQISRSQIKWYAHGDMKDLERVLQSVERDRKRKGGKLTRKFIVAEGIFENDGMMLDLPRVLELARKYKFRLMLDESMSFGMIGKHGRGITEHYGIPASEVDILMGSMATGLGAGGGFCAGSHVVCQHQRINSSASVFSASLPAMLATTSSHAISVLQSDPTILTTLQSNTLLFRQILNKLEALPIEIPECDPSYTPPPASIHPPIANKDAIISVPSHPQSALIHIFLLNPPPTLEEEEALLQEVVDETVNTAGLLITRARRLRGQETFEPEPSLKVCISAAFSRKEIEKAAQGLKAALIKVAGSE
ncbi:serine C-palmitoyltransferase [Papiliotrema laurentii]|uniref:serine C-palmitoyltransferase n=1 Tax=Papiliotrema laurentii TaxID=5418 RepID=A0AAD9CVP6_PAPLA|nr:serine C-palmitoyltransferase [Papiliotrema laurentii]